VALKRIIVKDIITNKYIHTHMLIIISLLYFSGMEMHDTQHIVSEMPTHGHFSLIPSKIQLSQTGHAFGL
jgi:hypothetical protein